MLVGSNTQLESRCWRRFDLQCIDWLARLWLELQLGLTLKPVAHVPAGVPNDAKSTEAITAPSGHPPMFAFLPSLAT